MNLFSEFQSMIKGKSTLQEKVMPTKDYSKTPQKFNIKGRQIQEKKLLAEGAFGFIWLAEDINSKEQFALKRVICMTPQSLEAAMFEKTIFQKIPASEHIVGYYGGLVFKNQGRTVVVTLMQLCSKGNLFDMLQKMQSTGISEDTIKQIARSVLNALITLHKSGYVHRDIKIENVLINKNNVMKVCDFGSCTQDVIDFAEIHKSQYQIVQEKIFAYTTPMYRPPEIVDPYLKYKINQKADLWMLGCVLYTMCYFIHPFVQSNAVGIAAGVFRFPEYPSETKHKVSEKVQDFIRNLLTPNPNNRPSAQKMLQLLDKWDSLQTIPLNQQAKKLKIQHMKKQQELKKLNKQVVQHDGDIPIQQLMKLQQKLKGKVQKEQFEGKSFITDKQTVKKAHNQLKSLRQNCKQAPQQSIKTVKKTDQKTVDIDSWGFFEAKSAQQPSSKKQMDFNLFDSFNGGSSSKVEKHSTTKLASNDDFMQFFNTKSTPVPKKPQQNSKKKVQSINLLDV